MGCQDSEFHQADPDILGLRRGKKSGHSKNFDASLSSVKRSEFFWTFICNKDRSKHKLSKSWSSAEIPDRICDIDNWYQTIQKSRLTVRRPGYLAVEGGTALTLEHQLLVQTEWKRFRILAFISFAGQKSFWYESCDQQGKTGLFYYFMHEVFYWIAKRHLSHMHRRFMIILLAI